MKRLRCDRINDDGSAQPRYSNDDEIIGRYREDMERGCVFPPIVVFHDGTIYWLADGYHRLFAAKELNRKSIDCDVRKGTQRDAILYSVGANATHGFQRNRQDKNQAVETLLRDEEWAKWSDREIAKRCEVSNTFVGNVRAKLSAGKKRPAVRECADGRMMDTAKIGKGHVRSVPGAETYGLVSPKVLTPREDDELRRFFNPTADEAAANRAEGERLTGLHWPTEPIPALTDTLRSAISTFRAERVENQTVDAKRQVLGSIKQAEEIVQKEWDTL